MKKIIASVFIFSFLFAGVAFAGSTSWQTYKNGTLTVYNGDNVNSGICYVGKHYLYNGNCTSPIATPHVYGVWKKIVEAERLNQFSFADNLREKWGL